MSHRYRHEFALDDGDIPQNRNHRLNVGKLRTNDEWILHLSGASGPANQQEAHEDLSRYLFVVIFNYLQKRRHSLYALSLYADEEIVPLVYDFVQLFMEKLVTDDYALLKKYSTLGRFTSWAAQVSLNLVSTEFRRACWSRQGPLTREAYSDQLLESPEASVLRAQVANTIERCLSKLPEHYRTVLVRCVAEDEKAVDIAEDMELSANAVYILIYRAKAALRKQLIREGVGPQTLSVYTEVPFP